MDKFELVKEAKKARELAYVPYSKFKVGAALLCQDGSVYYGANIENASYPLCMCAERNALYHALMSGKHMEDFVALAVVGDTKEPISPCGACRQVISEIFPRNGHIYLANLNDDILDTTIDDLLPYAFDDSDL